MIALVFDKLMEGINRKEVLTNLDHEPYLIRYFLYGKKSSSKKYRGKGIYLQKLIGSNYYNHPHDHPWRWGRFILKGQLIELIRNKNNQIDVVKIKRFSFTSIISSRFSHTQKLVSDQPVWMIFWHGRYKNRWGFWMKDKKIYWRDYYKLINRNISTKSEEITKGTV